MSVVQMEVGRYSQIPFNAPVFGRVDGRVCCIGSRVDKDDHHLGYATALMTRHQGIIIPWHKKQAAKTFGFYETVECAS